MMGKEMVESIRNRTGDHGTSLYSRPPALRKEVYQVSLEGQLSSDACYNLFSGCGQEAKLRTQVISSDTYCGRTGSNALAMHMW
jgi:hypothetical protein